MSKIQENLKHSKIDSRAYPEPDELKALLRAAESDDKEGFKLVLRKITDHHQMLKELKDGRSSS